MSKMINVNFDLLKEQLPHEEYKHFYQVYEKSSKRDEILRELQSLDLYIFSFEVSSKELAPYIELIRTFKAYKTNIEIVIEVAD